MCVSREHFQPLQEILAVVGKSQPVNVLRLHECQQGSLHCTIETISSLPPFPVYLVVKIMLTVVLLWCKSQVGAPQSAAMGHTA